MLSRERRAAKQLTLLDLRVNQSREVLMLLTSVVDVTGQDATSVVAVAMNVQLRRKMAKMEMIKVEASKEASQVERTSLVKEDSVVDSDADHTVEVAVSEVETIVVANQNAMEQHRRMTEQPANQRENALAMEMANHHAHHVEEASDEADSVAAQDAHAQTDQEMAREMDREAKVEAKAEAHVVVMILKHFHTHLTQNFSHSKFTF
jgi:hypothetical protein